MEQTPRIKWVRLQDISRDVLKRHNKEDIEVFLHGSMDLPANLRATVERHGARVDLLVNLTYNKGLKDIIKSLAHELAHIVLGLGDECHETKRFERTIQVLTGEISDAYDEGES